MLCKHCGHNNLSTASKCAGCGTEFASNEKLALFQAQAQGSKGIPVSINSQPAPSSPFDFSQPDLSGGGFAGDRDFGPNLKERVPSAVHSQSAADEFFADFTPPKKAPPPAAGGGKSEVQPRFFSNVQDATANDAQFETRLQSLRPEEEQGPEEHPLYSPPTNEIIEAYIARNNGSRRKS